ncbi:MAG: GntR family transcriptional regulator [Desulfatiglandales bacterium]
MDKKLKISIGSPVSIREKVYRTVKDWILDGRISPGSRIFETRLAKEIKTSRTPVREALHMLEREGLLEAVPRVGYRVKQIKWEEVEEICEIRTVLEILAAGWAVKRISAAEIKALQRNIEQTAQEAEEGMCHAFVERDAEFHEILVRASGSERLMELCEQLRRHMLRYRIESLYLPETALKANEGHRRIFACIKARDEEGIGAAIKAHLEYVKQSVRQYAFEEKQDKKTKLRAENE